jgi:hypothetical protein
LADAEDKGHHRLQLSELPQAAIPWS